MEHKLRQVRQARGLSQLELARRARIAPGIISMCENRKRVLYACEAERVAAALDYAIMPDEMKELR